MSIKKQQLHSTAMKRTTEWIFSQEIPKDVTINVGGTSFSLHKFPLISKCGYIKNLVSKASNSCPSVIEIPNIPGGSEAFELAAKFCYGISFEISIHNIAMLRCAAEYLEMTEDHSVGNLVNRAEAYLNEVALKSLTGAISVLHQCEKLLPVAENVKLVSRSIDAISYLAGEERNFFAIDTINENVVSSLGSQTKPILDLWAEDLTVLSIDIFQRVILAMISRGLKQSSLASIIILYAKNSLRRLEIFGKGRKRIEPKHEHEKRIMLETIVSLLPREKNILPVSFLCMLLRAALYLEAMVACRFDLEKRIALQLELAVLNDILIPSFSLTGDTIFDVETVKRIMNNYLEYRMEDNIPCSNANNNSFSPSLCDTDRVGKLMESYLAEISSDRNLTVSKFISLAELISKHETVCEDGIYRSIDIYFKAHPTLTDMEKKKICSLIDCQKLSIEASAHAAQNNRLPMQTLVQVLYHDKQQLREVMNGNLIVAESPPIPRKVNVYSMDLKPPSTEFSSLQRENEDLKIELVNMRMKLKELEKSLGYTSVSSTSSILTTTNKLHFPRKSFINSLSKKLGWLSPFMRPDETKTPDNKGLTKVRKDRRHSIS